MDRSERLKLLYAMFELNLKRALTSEERRLLSLADAYTGEDDVDLGDALAESAS